ncbi:MAG TPA: dNTP triphosphohydrolase [Planctomycetes bacterium]|nr:dNTP triphosphohydrolase [Planctomycetota bacterium]
MYYSAKDAQRLQPIKPDPRFSEEKYRTPWRRDCGRLIHSPSFRRLQGKSQLFPQQETDFFRNRLTHSLEVAQIAKSIAIKLNSDLENDGEDYRIEPDIVEFAALAHDLGHPPFGHFGEEVLDAKMIDFGGFEGNAQTLLLITRLEKRRLIENTDLGIDRNGKDQRIGLDLTCRSIASILKYDCEIPFNKNKRQQLLNAGGIEKISPIKGYYKTETQIVKLIKNNICNGKKYKGPFKTIECQIMDIADDIAYSTYDLEDCFKAGFTTPLGIIGIDKVIIKKVAEKVKKKLRIRFSHNDVLERIYNIFSDYFGPPYALDKKGKLSQKELASFHFFSMRFANFMSTILRENGYFRTDFTSKLVGRAIRNVSIDKINRSVPALSTVQLEKETAVNVELLKHIVYESQILSPKVQIIAFRTEEIIGDIFDAVSNKKRKGRTLLPKDFRKIYETVKGNKDKKRVICDFIASMTDRYALEFYGRLTSENPQTIFKPF